MNGNNANNRNDGGTTKTPNQRESMSAPKTAAQAARKGGLQGRFQSKEKEKDVRRSNIAAAKSAFAKALGCFGMTA